MPDSYLDGLLLGRPEDDEPTRGARIGSAFYIAASFIVLATVPFLPRSVPRLPVAIMAGVALACGMCFTRLPWSRWGMGPLVAMPILGYLLLAVLGLLAPGATSTYMPLYMLTFVYIGLVAKPGTAMKVAPLAVASYVVGNLRTVDVALVRLAITIPVWLFVGEVLARLLAYRTRELRQAADTDPLTRLDNRRSYDRSLGLMGAGDAVVLVDLDHFKEVNDRRGHQAGDDALRHLAEAMREETRVVDCVARFGGDEFALVLTRAGANGARDVLARLRDRWNANNGVTTFSAGIAVHRVDEDPASTFERADQSLYRAKARGRDRIELAPSDVVVSPSFARGRVDAAETA